MNVCRKIPEPRQFLFAVEHIIKRFVYFFKYVAGSRNPQLFLMEGQIDYILF